MKKKFVIGVILFVILFLAIGLYFYYPPFQISRINGSIDIAGIKLLMPIEEVTAKMGGVGKYIPGMGGFGCKYENEKIGVFFSGDPDSRAYNKVSFIETGNPNHSVLGIHPGDSTDKALSMLDKSGFKRLEQHYFENGDIFVTLTSENNTVKEIRIGYIDRSLSGRVY